jgi:small subunit ribosomal protein S6e
MVEFKIVIGDSKTKRAFKSELKSPDAEQLLGKKIGDMFRGELINLPGFEFQITGGSDKAGFPLYPDLEGQGKRRLLLEKGDVGFNEPKKFKGVRVRKLVRGNTIATDTVQINCKITKWSADIDLMKHFNVIEKPKEPAKTAEVIATPTA